MKRLLAVFLALLAWPAWAQLPPAAGLVVGNTPIQNGTNGRCLYDNNGKLGEQACGAGTAANIQVGTTTVGGGTSGRVLYDNAGVLGELTVTGTGSAVLSTSPTITTPTLASVAWGSIPAAGTAGRMVRCSDCGTKGAVMMDDGTRWKPMNGCAVLASLDSTSASVGNSETILFQYQIPIGLLQTGDRLKVILTMTKSGTADTASIRFRVGTAGTTSDTQLFTGIAIGTASRYLAINPEFRLESATSLQQLAGSGSSQANIGYSSTAVGAVLGPVAITSAAANALYFSVSILSGGVTDTVALLDAQLQICASAN